MNKKRKLSKWQECIGDQLRGRRFKSKEDLKKAFKEGVKFCKIEIAKEKRQRRR